MLGIASSSFAYTYEVTSIGGSNSAKTISCPSSSVYVYLEVSGWGGGSAHAGVYIPGEYITISNYSNTITFKTGTYSSDSAFGSVYIFAETSSNSGYTFARARVSW